MAWQAFKTFITAAGKKHSADFKIAKFTEHHKPGVVLVPPVLLVVVEGAGGLVVDDVPVVVVVAGGVGNPEPAKNPGTSACRLCMPC